MMARPNWEYIRVDVLLMENRKVEELSDRAFRALIDLWCYCGRNQTDGSVTDRRWKAIPPKARKELLAAGLAEQGEHGEIAMHDYLAHQRSRAEIEALSAKRTEAARKAAAARWGSKSDAKDDAKTHAKTHDDRICDSMPKAEAEAEAKKEKTPPSPAGSAPPKGGKLATRIPDDFTVTLDMVAWARDEVPGVDGKRETAKFIDYWTAASGAKARKVNWVAAWKYWMRQADERTPGRAGAQLSLARPQRPTTNDRVQQAIEAGKRVEAMLNGARR
jgi:hypothetical protein